MDALSEENHEAQNREQQVQQPLQGPSTAVGVATPIADKETPVRHPDSTLRDPNYNLLDHHSRCVKYQQPLRRHPLPGAEHGCSN